MADEAFAENPWSAEFWNLTRQGAYIKKYGIEVAKTKAKQAGTKLGLPQQTKDTNQLRIERHWIIQKKIGGSGGQGFSGSGAPQ